MGKCYKYGVTLIIMFSLIFSSQTAFASFTISAQGAILMEQESGRVLFEKDAYKPLRIASITKIMTAILAIESGKMSETVTVSKNAFGKEGSSLYLKLGEKIKLEDLVYGLMLRSGNDAAIAIAEHVGGSVDGFVYLMNQKAKEIGMQKTKFANPHGLDDHEEHYSTAYDMALLTKYAMENEHYQKISGTKSYRAPQEGETWDRIWHNKNRLLTQLYKYCTGGKTGYTKRAKRTLVSTASKENMNLIAVTLNAPSDWQDHMNMYNWGFESFQNVTVVEEGIVLDIKDDFYKQQVKANYSFQYPVTASEKDSLTKTITLLKPPKDKKWQTDGVPNTVGKITIQLKEQTIGEVPLSYIGEIEKKKSIWSKLKDIFFFMITYGNSGVQKDKIIEAAYL